MSEGPKAPGDHGAAAPIPEPLSWREKRWERRRKRRLAEEVLGWILVPVILVAAYGFLKVILGALGTTPGAVLGGIKTLMSGIEKL